jgi:hypothetical protein
LAVLNDRIQPPIKTQKQEELANLYTYAFTNNKVPHVFGDHYFAGLTYEYNGKYIERCNLESFKADLRKGIKKKGPLTGQIGVPNHLARGLGPATSPPDKGGGQASQPGCGHTLGVPAP